MGEIDMRVDSERRAFHAEFYASMELESCLIKMKK